jgi:hypothetical protein
VVEGQVYERRQSRLRLFIAAVVGILGCCGVLSYLATRPTNGIRVQQLEAEIKERLPLGSSREQVEGWFASHRITPQDVCDLDGRKIGLGVVIPNSTWLETAEIQVWFYFDQAGRLEKAIIDRFVISL